jgi:hypothetical protein
MSVKSSSIFSRLANQFSNAVIKAQSSSPLKVPVLDENLSASMPSR